MFAGSIILSEVNPPVPLLVMGDGSVCKLVELFKVNFIVWLGVKPSPPTFSEMLLLVVVIVVLLLFPKEGAVARV